jgi:hypothetical protein
MRAAVGTMVEGRWAGGSPGRGTVARGSRRDVMRCWVATRPASRGGSDKRKRGRARTVELACSERWVGRGRGQAARAGQQHRAVVGIIFWCFGRDESG